MMRPINRRIQMILEDILNNDYITAQELIDKHNISKRTLYYDLSKVNGILEDDNLGHIHNNPQTGFYIDEKVKNQIRSQYDIKKNSEYIHSVTERCNLIIIRLLACQRKVTLDNLQNDFAVSRNTVVNDLKNVKETLELYHLSMVASSGYHISGTEKDRRTLFSDLFNDNRYLFENEQGNRLVLKSLSGVPDNEYLSDYLLTFYKQIYNGNHVSEINAPVIRTKACLSLRQEIGERLNMEISTEEDEFLSVLIDENIHLIDHLNKTEKQKAEQYLTGIRDVIVEFEKMSCTQINDIETLQKNIYNHLIPYIVKARYGIYLQNQMKEAIRTKYSVVYSITQNVIERYAQAFDDFRFTPDMVSYIVLYFGALMHDTSDLTRRPRILIACNKGYATSQMLALQIEEIFPDFEKVGVVKIDDIQKYYGRYDFVVTSEKNYQGPNIINVEAILTEADKEKLLFQISNMQIEARSRNFLLEHIMNSVQHNADVKDSDHLYGDLKNILDNVDLRNNRYLPSLSQMLTKDMIQIVDQKCSWEEAIDLGAKPLLNCGDIVTSYVDEIKRTIKVLGPYFVIGSDVALAHGSPEDGTVKLGVSLTIFRQAVTIENKAFRVLIVLAPIDKSSHINVIADINQLLSDSQKRNDLICAKDIDDIFDILKR